MIFPTGDQKWPEYQAYAKAIWAHLHWTTDKVPHYATDGRDSIKGVWFGCGWVDFFDLFEKCVSLVAATLRRQFKQTDQLYEIVNALLEGQGCAYRFISEELAPITNPIEMAAVEQASESAIGPVATHIRGALEQLPPNPKASPRNSVKESISAVEATLKHLTGSPNLTLGKGLDAFEAKYGKLHDSMRRGFDKLYAYTNQPEGMRHALIDGAREVTVDDARLMLIQCSAFANYLIAVAAAAKP